jgi:catechol 2,3-dioxygenase-like lactoylglutathione lyase family enzyme
VPSCFPGEIRQVGHVVEDLDAAIDAWRAVGVGPWLTFDSVLSGGTFRGAPSEPTLRVAFANDGDMQLELIQAMGEHTSVWHEYRDAGRFGPQHVAYWAEDFDAARDRLDDAGVEVVQAFGGDDMPRVLYVANPTGGLLVEIMELTAMTRAFMDHIRAESAVWTSS